MRDETTIRPVGAGSEPFRGAAAASDPPAALPQVSLLTVQFLGWVAAKPRTRADVMDAWRSTCPRQSVWEDSVIDGLVAFDGGGAVVLTPLGKAVLRAGAPSSAIGG